jgi:hypothetical protein
MQGHKGVNVEGWMVEMPGWKGSPGLTSHWECCGNLDVKTLRIGECWYEL